MKYKFTGDTGVFHQDCGPWRSYELDTYGNDYEELVKNATIAEIDQDGECLDFYPLCDGPSEVERVSLEIIMGLINETI